MSKHTTGPWKRDLRQRDLIEGGPGTFVAQVLNHFNPNRADSALIFEANAHLIAAAPDLLAALERLCAQIEAQPNADVLLVPFAAIQRAQAAIAKAKGGAA